jgi:hypothetical protein
VSERTVWIDALIFKGRMVYGVMPLVFLQRLAITGMVIRVHDGRFFHTFGKALAKILL